MNCRVHRLACLSLLVVRQREMYEIYLRLYLALLTSIDVHKRPIDVIGAAVTKMDAIMASYPFTDQRIKAAATKFATALTNSDPIVEGGKCNSFLNEYTC